MRTAFLVLIASIFVITLGFAILIWRQTIKFEKTALAAKQRKEEYLHQLEIQRQKEGQELKQEKDSEKMEVETNRSQESC